MPKPCNARPSAAVALLAGLAALAGPARATAEPWSQEEQGEPEIRRSLFGPPLVVDGKPIPEERLKRFLALGVGTNQVQVAKFSKIIEFELALRAANGEDVSKYEVTPEEADKKFAKEVESFQLDYPTLDVETEIGRSFLHVDLYRAQLENAMLFDKLFFPPDPADWPEVTKQLVIGAYGEEWIEDSKQSYETRKAAAIEHDLEEIPEEDPIAVETQKSAVLEGLRDFYAIESDPDQLQPGVLLAVEDMTVTIDEIFEQIAPYLRRDHVEDAKRWAVLTRLLEDYLAAQVLPDGRPALIPQAEWRESFTEPGRTYDQTLNDYDMVALQVMGFPSLQAYALHKRLTDSYARLLQAETDARAAASGRDMKGKVVDDETLRAALPWINKITGGGKTNVEVILISAFDFEHDRWKEGGWAWAEQHAAEVKRKLDEGASWDEVLQHESEFWDPPLPDRGHRPQYGMTFKGKFGGQPQTRNQLLTLLGESEYRNFVDGGTVTDFIVFEQERGTIEGPRKGVFGYYISRHMGQSPPVSPLNINEPAHRDIALQHYLKDALKTKGHELLAAALAEGRVQGL